jgi:GTP cyclohydrolase II
MESDGNKRKGLAKKGENELEEDLAPARASKKRRSDDSAESSEWNQMFFELMLYKANNGNTFVKSKDETHSKLYKWSAKQRRHYKVFQKDPSETSEVTEDRIKVLESVRFAFTSRGDDHWERHYEKLRQFKQDHGHVLVSRQSEVPGLGDWVS